MEIITTIIAFIEQGIPDFGQYITEYLIMIFGTLLLIKR